MQCVFEEQTTMAEEGGVPRDVAAMSHALNLEDLWVTAVMTGDVRGGSGERDLFYRMFLTLAVEYPRTSMRLLRELPAKFGSWRTLNQLYEIMTATVRGGEVDEDTSRVYTSLCEEIVRLYASQLRLDEESSRAVCGGKRKRAERREDAGGRGAGKEGKEEEEAAGPRREGPSLAAKWAPRVGSAVDKACGLGLAIAARLFPSHRAADADKGAAYSCMRYRKLVSSLNKQLRTVEVSMCGGDWSAIVPSSVPALANRKYRKAFLNAKGVDSADRRASAARFLDVIEATRCGDVTGRAAMKGAQEHINVLVQTCMRGREEDPMVEAMYVSLREDLRAKGKLPLSVALVDVSGSMSGTPMEVAISLGILLSELAPAPWTRKVLTFESDPRFCEIPEGSLHSMVRYAQDMPWGGSTNFEAAMARILDVCLVEGVKEADLPTLFVFSDMQFNEAAGHDAVRHPHEVWTAMWREAGYSRCPHVVYWNLRSYGRATFEATSTTPGVSLMSGFSQQGLKVFLEEGELASAPEATPYDTLRLRLDNERYDPVRAVCREVREGDMALLPVPEEGQDGGDGGGADGPQ
jgi:Mg-chelatase subunit ChlD